MDSVNSVELSIIILNYKTRKLLRQCLRGIYAHPPRVPFEVIVVDNGSRDGTVDMVADEFPNVIFEGLPTNIGYPKGSNVGIELSKGRYLLFLNADVVVLPNSLEGLYRYAQVHTDVGAVGPQLKNPDGSIQESAYSFHRMLTPLYQRTPLGRTRWGRREVDRFLMRDWDHLSDRDVPWLMSSCLLVRRQALNDTGVFDERFFVYLADTDLCRRLWLHGWKVRYASSVNFVHYHRRQSAGEWRVALTHILDWIRYVRKWRGRPLPMFLTAK